MGNQRNLFNTVLDRFTPPTVDPCGYAIANAREITPLFVSTSDKVELAERNDAPEPFIYGLSSSTSLTGGAGETIEALALLNEIQKLRFSEGELLTFAGRFGLLVSEEEICLGKFADGRAAFGMFLKDWLFRFSQARGLQILLNYRVADDRGRARALAALTSSVEEFYRSFEPDRSIGASPCYLSVFLESQAVEASVGRAPSHVGSPAYLNWLTEHWEPLSALAVEELNAELSTRASTVLMNKGGELLPVLKFSDGFGHIFGALALQRIGYDRDFRRCKNPYCPIPIPVDVPGQRRYCSESCKEQNRYRLHPERKKVRKRAEPNGN